MKKNLALSAAILFVASVSFAAAATKYQVTGPVLEVTDTSIVVQKGKDKWMIARDAGSKVTGDVKVGAKVTIEYRMTAVTIDVQPAKAPAASSKTKKP